MRGYSLSGPIVRGRAGLLGGPSRACGGNRGLSARYDRIRCSSFAMAKFALHGWDQISPPRISSLSVNWKFAFFASSRGNVSAGGWYIPTILVRKIASFVESVCRSPLDRSLSPTSFAAPQGQILFGKPDRSFNFRPPGSVPKIASRSLALRIARSGLVSRNAGVAGMGDRARETPLGIRR